MSYTPEQIVEESLSLVHEKDREALAEYLKKSSIASARCRYFIFGYHPFAFLINDRDSFYQYSALEWLIKPVVDPRGEREKLILACDSFRGNEYLYVSKTDGYVYYSSYANPSIKVGDSLKEVWEYFVNFDSRLKEHYENQNQDDDALIDEELLQESYQYALKDAQTDVKHIFNSVASFCKKEGFPYVRFENHEIYRGDFFQRSKITRDNFFKRSNFQLSFPFAQFSSVEKFNINGSGGNHSFSLLRIGDEIETGCSLFYSPESRVIARARYTFRFSREINRQFQKNPQNFTIDAEEPFKNRFFAIEKELTPFIIQRKNKLSLLLTPIHGLYVYFSGLFSKDRPRFLDCFSAPLITLVDPVEISDSFSSFLDNLRVIDKEYKKFEDALSRRTDAETLNVVV